MRPEVIISNGRYCRELMQLKKSNNQLLSLAKELYSGLKHEVYDIESVEVIKMTKVILDLLSLAIKLKHSEGYIKLALTQFPLFINAVKSIPVRSLLCVSEEDLKNKYKEFLQILENITRKKKEDELEDIDPK
ncbi:unnamed protein product [Meganyctiphanes norvegica]|uniref:Uncharacterized protein n=1 Tax=Meganyctiphanes norvegica TaxID=48144 RepID=A0AAV2SN98_MEGNR